MLSVTIFLSIFEFRICIPNICICSCETFLEAPKSVSRYELPNICTYFLSFFLYLNVFLHKLVLMHNSSLLDIFLHLNFSFLLKKLLVLLHLNISSTISHIHFVIHKWFQEFLHMNQMLKKR